MSGRVMDSDRVKHGEILDMDLMNLTENYGEGASAMRMAGEYKERRRQMGRKPREEMSESEEEERHVLRKKLPEEMPGQTEQMNKYLARLPERHKEKMRMEEGRLFDGGRRKGKVEVARHKEGESHMYPAADADKLRREVLSVSLFPNLYNKKNLLMSM